jgi:type IV pilus assembly protein PilE
MTIRGFTLLELLVVIAIIGILSSIGVVAYNGYTESAAQKAAENSLQAMTIAQQEYKSNNGTYFTTGGTSGTCSPTQVTTSAIVGSSTAPSTPGLFSGTDNLTSQRYYFCTTADSSSYKLTAKHNSKTCEITLTNFNIWNRTECDG